MIDSSNSKAIFISEESELTSTDYLLRAIVNLGYVKVDGRKVREITWEKLRGQPIFNRKSSYTLNNGHFLLAFSTRVRNQETP